MKNKILLVLGLVTIFSSSIVYAKDSIEAILFPVSYEINNHKMNVEEGYVTINYNNRAYVPVRFIAENLGARVNYNESDKTITINDTNIFSANNTKRGNTIAGMEVEELNISHSDDIPVGTIQFTGTTILTGKFLYTDIDATGEGTLLFTVDEATSNNLPRLSHDLRDPIIVFSNDEEAKEILGVDGWEEDLSGKAAAIIIDNFNINYQEKNIHNKAQLKHAYLHFDSR